MNSSARWKPRSIHAQGPLPRDRRADPWAWAYAVRTLCAAVILTTAACPASRAEELPLLGLAHVETLGFHETWSRNQPDGTPVLNHLRLAGPSGDYIELSNKPKPISRAQAGTGAHISLEVPEIRAAQKEVLARAPGAALKEPHFGLDQRWQFNLFDPDGTRVELMQPRADAPK